MESFHPIEKEKNIFLLFFLKNESRRIIFGSPSWPFHPPQKKENKKYFLLYRFYLKKEEKDILKLYFYSQTNNCRLPLIKRNHFSFKQNRKIFLFIFNNIFFFSCQKEEKIKKYSSSTSLRGGSLFSSKFSFSSCQKGRKKYSSSPSLRGVLYFHWNFILFPVKKEKNRKKKKI